MLFTSRHEEVLKQEIKAIFDSADKTQAVSKLKTKLMTLNTIDGGKFEMTRVGEYLATCLASSSESEKALFAPVFRLIDIHRIQYLRVRLPDSKTLLQRMFEIGDIDALQLLQVYEPNILDDINAPQNDEGNTLLHLAVKAGNREMVKDLLEMGWADIKARNRENKTALHLAVLAKNRELVNLLLENGANVHARDSSQATPLHDAVFVADIVICRRLVEAGANVYAASRFCGFPLHRALTGENFKVMVDWLIDECGVDINAYDDGAINQETALFLVREIPEKSAYLLTKGADPNIGDELGCTPLHYLSDNPSFIEEAKVLLRGGARVDIENNPTDPGDDQWGREPSLRGDTPLEKTIEGSNNWKLLKNFSEDKIIIEAIYQIAKPIFIDGVLNGLLIPDLQNIIFGVSEQKSNKAEKPEEAYGYSGLPEGKVIEVAEQCLFSLAKKSLAMRREKEALEKQLAEEKSEHAKASLQTRIGQLDLEINPLINAATQVIALVPLPGDCAEYWNILRTKNTVEDLEEVQRPSKPPKLISSAALPDEKEREEKHSRSSSSTSTKREVGEMDTSPDGATLLSPATIQVSTPFSISSSSSSSSASMSTENETPWYWKIDARAKPESIPEPKQEKTSHMGKRKRGKEEEKEEESEKPSVVPEEKQLTPSTMPTTGNMNISFFEAQHKKAKKVQEELVKGGNTPAKFKSPEQCLPLAWVNRHG